jgi:acetylornithine deacetylase/succinyl-diaminopimelate desuccinylase-like protein
LTSNAGVSIDENELVQLALDLGNIDSPTGEEGPAGEFVYDWLVETGFDTKKIGMFDDRFNVLGTLAGTSDGNSLIFNSHYDTGKHGDDRWSLRNARDLAYHTAWRDGDLLYGEGVVNDKGPMAAFLMAAKAIKSAGIELKGDLLVSAVPGEIGMEPVDEFQAPKYLSKEVGARFLVQHGGVADYALIAEGTDFKAAWIEAGKAFFKITVHGDKQFYTPFAPDAEVDSAHPNAIVRAAYLIPTLQEWGREYERSNRYESPGGTIVPKVTIGAVRGGNAYHVTRTSELCAVYLDVRLVPDQDPLAARAELRRILRKMGIPGDVELFLYRRSYQAEEPGLLLESLEASHDRVVGGSLEIADYPFSSMWRDISIFNEMGIPAITYGPGAAVRGSLSMRIADLLQAAQVYADLAIRVCSREKALPGSTVARPMFERPSN